jgi:hypothetical protein
MEALPESPRRKELCMRPLAPRQKISILALAVVLAAPWTAGATPWAGQQPSRPSFLQQIWTVLTSALGLGVTPDAGCNMDPSGGCASGGISIEPPWTPDAGCNMDPDGRCGLTSRDRLGPIEIPQAGCQMDPSGACNPGS